MSVNTIAGVTTASGSTASPHQPEDGRPIILVVDDRAINRDFLVSLLSYSGYRTIEANSPTELPAVDHLDLIISDVHMPSMNGLTFLQAMRADSITRQVPVILYTAAYKTPELEARAKALGAFAVLTKPTAPEVILEYVRAALLANAWRNPVLSSEVKLARPKIAPSRRAPSRIFRSPSTRGTSWIPYRGRWGKLQFHREDESATWGTPEPGVLG